MRAPACLLLLPLAATLGSCISSSIRHSILGNDLDYERTVELPFDASVPAELWIDSAIGDLRIVSAVGAPRILVEVHEEAPQIARVSFENGRLRLDMLDEDDALIGDVTLEIDGFEGDVHLSSGVGEVRVEGVAIGGGLFVHAGTGDVRLTGLGSPSSIEVDNGVGDVEVSQAVVGTLKIDSGTGDIRVEDIWADRVDLDSGVGDIRVRSSTIRDLRADSGIGDISLEACDVASQDLDTGIGSIRH